MALANRRVAMDLVLADLPVWAALRRRTPPSSGASPVTEGSPSPTPPLAKSLAAVSQPLGSASILGGFCNIRKRLKARCCCSDLSAAPSGGSAARTYSRSLRARALRIARPFGIAYCRLYLAATLSHPGTDIGVSSSTIANSLLRSAAW
eukprot:CAMPEP_0119119788 /NCGR_PEP_ID=MMETSP1310-20130426/1125_1 /TAXON_ID=464262 /ORGANISM="Genus nov. species nov., Strain RCC2339" /LENGTH=148 /DNA_ID=CAMNT_0007109237 /DNA_START=386 /DNA_END=832 /DNA_ORIENTATION=-